MTNNKAVSKISQHTRWLTIKEAAAQWGTSTRGITKAIRLHREALGEGCVGGGKGNPLSITSEALFKLRTIANIRSRKNTVGYLRKTNIADKAIEAIKEVNTNKYVTNPSDLDKLVLLSQNLLASIGGLSGKIEHNKIEQDKKIADVEARLKKQEDELSKPLTPNSIQRKFLGDRVKLYAITQSIPFHTVWSAVNTHVGRGGVAFYDFADYQKAIKFIKGMYEQAGMGWD